jgi:hypothetical protein
MTMQASQESAAQGVRPSSEQTAALRPAVRECYCGWGPACPLWNQYSPEQRVACSLDKRAVAQAQWMNGM